ncbi:class I SAM-dependent methyltransferase [bacterium]|nr:class I SAM-dependent methyltransferase [bacterium]
MESPKPIICNLCGSNVTSVLVSKGGHKVYQCGKCSLAFTWPQPEAIADQYDASYFDLYRRRRSFRLKRGDSRLRKIELIREPGRLLDIGCSLGYFVEAANTRGWCASGVEISPYASEEARKMGLDVKTGVLEDAGYRDCSFDCVTMWDVLEHVPDPTAHMIEVNRILSPGGMVVIGTPNLGHIRFRAQRENWRHLKPAEHIFYFMKSSISRLLDKTGFDLVDPPVSGGRKFPGSTGAAIRGGMARLFQLNDVLTVYGVKR